MQNSACLTAKNIALLRAAHYSQIPRLAKPGHGRSLPCHRTWRHQTDTPLRGHVSLGHEHSGMPTESPRKPGDYSSPAVSNFAGDHRGKVFLHDVLMTTHSLDAFERTGPTPAVSCLAITPSTDNFRRYIAIT